ncbi:Peptidase family M23 [Micromonospora nigra]|uniref:Peptidase family M23 n=1 Tax=Micromonospora nigra TaxID=145857 RepID=A0A1C6SL12_9ACTN|nr:M23 family metallopeptidase [Micromonospora nigra]SCL30234.1 Peptidase family M23 [Micromonospora nigra]
MRLAYSTVPLAGVALLVIALSGTVPRPGRSDPAAVAPAHTALAGSIRGGSAPADGAAPAGSARGASVPAGGPALTGSVPAGPALLGPFTVRADARNSVRFRWPLDGVPRPVRRFDPPPQPWLPGHRGVDLAAVPGATVRAAGAGIVLFAGPVAGRPVVTVGHADGLRTTYEPVRPTVRAGDTVPAGALLGELLAGHAGCPAPACLHWGLRRAADYLDPLVLLGLGRVRLLPLTEP